MARDLDSMALKVVLPKGGQPADVTAGTHITGLELKALLLEQVGEVAVGSSVEGMGLVVQNGSRNAAKVPVEDEQTLAEQGIEEGATVTVKLREEVVTPDKSALRQNIAKNGKSSYYYAHANEKALPAEHRYAYGGEPAKLDAPLNEAAAAEGAAADAVPAVSIAKYSWADEGDFVCIYISADDETGAIEAAGDGKADQVKTTFDTKSVQLRISSECRHFALCLRNLENEIVPEECKHRVSAGKRVTLKLRKRRPTTWTRLVKSK